jgi:hypothetical protein
MRACLCAGPVCAEKKRALADVRRGPLFPHHADLKGEGQQLLAC